MDRRTRNERVSFGYQLIPSMSIVAALLILSACSPSGSKTSIQNTNKRSRSTEEKGTASAKANPDPGINLNCIYDRLQKPPESFHYVYKKNASDGFIVDQEADVTPQTIGGFRKQSDGSQQPLHGVLSDPPSWQAALAGLTGISGMSGTVSTFNHSSAMQRESDGGQVNGYETIHYSIDTARWDATTREMLGNFTLGPGGFDKGDVWVTSEGCPVKLSLDDEMHRKDGSLIGKVHYEEAMVKK